jgi:hypothetical protein
MRQYDTIAVLTSTAGDAACRARPHARSRPRAMDESTKEQPSLDLRHIGRVLDKDMPIDQPGMEMSKPGSPDMRRRKHTVVLPGQTRSPGPENPPQTTR